MPVQPLQRMAFMGFFHTDSHADYLPFGNASNPNYLLYYNPWVSAKLLRVHFGVDSVVGSPLASDTQMAVFDASLVGGPGSNQLTPWVPVSGSGVVYTGTCTVDFSSLNFILQQDTVYWIGYRYIGDPSNRINTNHFMRSTLAGYLSDSSAFATWDTSGDWVPTIYHIVTDSGEYGFTPVVRQTVSFSSLMYGARFRTPASCRVLVFGAGLHVYASANSLGAHTIRLYFGSTLLASGTIYVPSMSGSQSTQYHPVIYGFFSSPVWLEPSTTYRLVVVPTADKTLSTQYWTVYTEDPARPSIPYNTMVTYSADGGVTWFDLSTSVARFILLVDADDPNSFVRAYRYLPGIDVHS